MAGVGPGTSLALALVFAVIGLALRRVSGLVGGFFVYLATVNGGLAAFNLLPGLPLDGGRILRAIVWQVTGNYRRATAVAAMVGRGVAFLLIGGGILIAFSLDWFSGLWLAFVGWFMENAATQSYRSVLIQEALRGVTVANLMTPDCTRVPRGMSVAELVDHYVFPHGRRCFIVADGEMLEGLITVHNVRDLPRERWPFTPVGEIMIPLARLVLAHLQEDAFEVMKRMDERNVNQMPVEQDGRIVGMIARENLIRYMRTRAELGM